MNLHYDLNTYFILGLSFVVIYYISHLLEKNYSLHHKKNNLTIAITGCVIWILAALTFNGILWYYLKSHFNLLIANQKALEFITGYILERSLSIDNLFVFILIFKYFDMPENCQKTALKFGIIMAILLRILMIFFGIWLIEKVHAVLYLFGVILIISGGKILFGKNNPNKINQSKDLSHNLILVFCKKHFKKFFILNTELNNYGQIFIRKGKKLYATSMFLVIILITATDLIFAIDSIPAILGILNDPVIIIISNVFAVLGLSSLYHLLSISIKNFSFLQKTIALLLIFVGIKMLFNLKLSITLSLIIILLIIIISPLFSIVSKIANK